MTKAKKKVVSSFMIMVSSCMLVSSLMLVSCEKVDLDNASNSETANGGAGDNDGNGSASGSHKVVVVTRSSSTEALSYPIDIYAYDSKGNVAAHQTVTSASENISMSLKEGQYTIAAMSGASASGASASGTSDKDNGYSTLPVMTGSTTVTVGGSAVTANIVLSYAVASLDLSLTNVPSSVTEVSVTVASQYSSVSNLREYSGSMAVTIPCSKQGTNTWKTGTVYVLPGCKESTVMTVSLTSGSSTTSYGITYPSALKAATPYHFTGTYSGESNDVKLSGTLSQEDWLAAVDGSFSFGPSGSNSFSGEQGTEEFKVSSIPAQGSVWDGHLVAWLNEADGSGGADALLLSVTEWSSLTSALYESDATVAQRLVDGYVENGLSGWSIPSNDEVRNLRAVWSSENIGSLNSALATISGSTAVSVTDEEGKNVRYLCEGATYSYGWAKGSSILAAGKTVKTYRLRAVKKVRFVVS